MLKKYLQNPNVFILQVEYLSLLPIGTKENTAAMNLMAKVMSNNVASAYNFDGKTWKLAFKETKMWQAVEGKTGLFSFNFLIKFLWYCYIIGQFVFLQGPLLNILSTAHFQRQCLVSDRG